MSLLETMRNKKKDLLTERHPMKDSDRGTRFAYLVGLAMGAVVDGTVHQKEREAVMERAFTLELPEEDGTRAIETAEKADDGTVSSVLESLTDPVHRDLFLTDLKIMGHSDGSVAPEEDELWNLFANMMKVGEDERKALTGFASAAVASDGKAASEALSAAIGKGLDLPISALKFFFPSLDYRESLKGRTVGPGERLIISRPTALEGPIVVTQGGELVIDGAEVFISAEAYGSVPENEHILSAITVWGGSVKVKDATFRHTGGNLSPEEGQRFRMAVVSGIPSLTVTGTAFDGSRQVPGLEVFGCSSRLENCSFSGCYGPVNGAGLFHSGPLEMKDCSFSDCAALEGGGVYAAKGKTTVTGTTFTSCSAKNGGGIALEEPSIPHLEHSSFYDCSATDSGGGICLTSGEKIPLNIIGCSFQDCGAIKGGGIATKYGDRTTSVNNGKIEGSSFVRCRASGNDAGGAIDIYYLTPKPSIEDNTFEGCSPQNEHCY